MPVDLSPAGRPSAYPRRMRFWPWACTWFVCNVFGPVIVLLAWPKGEPASGLKFWSWIVGGPNGLFLVLLGFGRAGYEVLWYRAYWRNHHRDRWLAEKIRFAQRSLHVLGAGYCLPLAGKSLSEVLEAKKPILKKQAPRHGSGKVLCNRFADDEPLLAAAFAMNEEDDQTDDPPEPVKIAPAVQMIRLALEPLIESIRALTRYEATYWPQVRVLVEPKVADQRLAQVRDAMRLVGLPPLTVQPVSASDGLLVADAWLDAHERRPLLVIAAAWYEDDIDEGFAEGCTAVLLDAGYFKLPSEVSRKAKLCRPIAGNAVEPEYGFADAAICGKTDAAVVKRAWITRPIEKCDEALRAAGFLAAAKDAAQCRLDRIVGNACAGNSLLAIAAAIEARADGGPQLVVDGLQSAILHVISEDQTVSAHVDIQK
ncbi:hypothetical protein WJ96_28555 [Burkholderia ubonensis]|uniref:Uncharacterized protein n=1 Tax=Burkholderia ubonensis TaxID=101571 RepID=A0AAW3N846_9BURK|nr:hypothetical protein WJ96_28555 [Burkholderia ubonensis]KVZ87118.1 hypothetical protein WL25_29390 [Burkholderia ubonensis]KWD50257.1 hypothetical protein WL66_18850 [Burkholderia ubonensis]KWD66203.1 hypothetical protein WL67_02305 [Burkholderia ubonensis]